MKVLKWILGVIGLAATAVMGFYLFRAWVEIGKMMTAANTNRSQSFPSPINYVYLSTGLALAAGLILGLALGLPARTARSMRHDLEQESRHEPAHVANPPATEAKRAVDEADRPEK